MSLIARINTIIRLIKDEQASYCPPTAAREFAIAITALEDAQMRIARGQAVKLLKIPTPEDVAKVTLAEESVHPDQLQFSEDESDLAGTA